MSHRNEERRPAAHRATIKKGSSTLGISLTETVAELRWTGCPTGCGPDGHEPGCGITAPPTDPGSCRCQRARWTGEGVFICVCREEVA